MPIAANPDTGDVSYLDDSGKWTPAKKSVNPETREVMAYDATEEKWTKVSMHGAGILSYVDDAVRSLASGMTFGYADTIAAAINSALGLGKGDYSQELERQRERSASIPAAISIPGEVAGAVASSVAAAPAAGAAATVSGVAKLPALARTMLGGATAGGLFASSEGTGIEDRLSRVPGGATAGAVGGAAFHGAAKAVSAVKSPFERAGAQLKRALTRDNVTPEDLEKAVGLAGNKPVTLADVGGENTRGLVERMANTPGAGRTIVKPFLTERQAGQATRVASDLGELAGTQRSAKQAIDQTMTQRAEEATPLYEQAYKDGDKIIWSDKLAFLKSIPDIAKAMKSAVTDWKRSVGASGVGSLDPAKVGDGYKTNLQFWDYTKHALDDMIGGEIRADGTISKKGRDLLILNKHLVSEVDKQVGSYKAARESWAGHSSYLNSIKLGKGIMTANKSAEEALAEYGALSEMDKQAYREGAVSAILTKMENDPAKIADMTKYLRSEGMRKKVAGIMPTPEAGQKWLQRLDYEVRSSELVGQSLGNSATARRLAEKEDGSHIVGDLVINAFTGAHPTATLKDIIVKGGKRIRDTIRSRSDAELAKMLTGKSALRIIAPSHRRLGESPLVRGAGAAGTAAPTADVGARLVEEAGRDLTQRATGQ